MPSAPPPPNLPLSSVPNRPPMPNPTDGISAKLPGGGQDAPDPFAGQGQPVFTPPLQPVTPAPLPNPLPVQPQPNPIAPSPYLPPPLEAAPLAPPAFREPPKPQHSRRILLIIVGIIILFILLGSIGFVFSRLLSGSSSPVNSAVPSPSTTPLPSPSPLSSVAAVVTSPVVKASSGPVASYDPNNEVADPDKDGLTNAEERFYGTDANNPDTDGDGYPDGEEVKNGYNPKGPGKLDSDNDGFPDPDERAFGTDPFNPDTDGDGYKDGDEIKHSHNPLIPAPNDKL